MAELKKYLIEFLVFISGIWKEFRLFTSALLLVDLIFILIFVVLGALHVASGYDQPATAWNLDADGSYSEIFNYFKWAFIIFCLASAFARTKLPVFLSLALIFSIILFDDMLQIHERGGGYFVSYFDIPDMFGLRAQDFGELAVWALLGSVALLSLAVGVITSPVSTWPYTCFFVLILGGLCFTGIVLDMAGAWSGFDSSTLFLKVAIGVLTIAEDGGEMIFGSLGCGGAIMLLRRPDLLAWKHQNPVAV